MVFHDTSSSLSYVGSVSGRCRSIVLIGLGNAGELGVNFPFGVRSLSRRSYVDGLRWELADQIGASS